MKKVIALFAAVAAIGFALPSTAEANWGCNQRVVSYTACGRPIFAVYQIVGYDRCGNPIGQWVTQRSNCGCNRCSPRQSFGHGRNVCPPQPGFHRSSGGSSGGFFFRFGR
jgi:hypothetical protein